ncbi:MAG: DUF6174 domain-containing protein [Marinobacter sp.]|uniref:DUF6174 domain-containing protein n=1 Tax=Marinobacter sp. TaxID=50741 RepID=UPI0029C34300|nr:DUF6174 domain-containing protein [Marinobacter sp.]MDX5337221.1 DUF6174 domain-containing protein [Marinobacter sp.]MDX5388510.1 DUF6174 domain-containing protein [Marinobacter sp.]MDX5439173.1 DUF6174 domain-containing protein [Alteromonadaceae bacterium]MDX5473716.1 DUF6174 domain-containing protein [Marinobacter sp.]
MKPIVVAVILSVLLAGCAGAGKDASPASSIEEAKSLWQAQGVKGYEVTIEQTCFCPPDLLQPMRVTVREGKVIDIEGLQQPLNHPDILDERRLTIEGLLDLVEQARGSADKLLVEYDPHYGFPASQEVDYSPFIADDEFSYRLTDFQAY